MISKRSRVVPAAAMLAFAGLGVGLLGQAQAVPTDTVPTRQAPVVGVKKIDEERVCRSRQGSQTVTMTGAVKRKGDNQHIDVFVNVRSSEGAWRLFLNGDELDEEKFPSPGRKKHVIIRPFHVQPGKSMTLTLQVSQAREGSCAVSRTWRWSDAA